GTSGSAYRSTRMPGHAACSGMPPVRPTAGSVPTPSSPHSAAKYTRLDLRDEVRPVGCADQERRSMRVLAVPHRDLALRHGGDFHALAVLHRMTALTPHRSREVYVGHRASPFTRRLGILPLLSA